MLTGILKPTSGFCRINGKIPQDNRQDYVKDIGVVFGQRTQLWWDLALQRDLYGLERDIRCARLALSISAWTFE